MPAAFRMTIVLIVSLPTGAAASCERQVRRPKKPTVGAPGSHSSLTGASEKPHGGAVEQEHIVSFPAPLQLRPESTHGIRRKRESPLLAVPYPGGMVTGAVSAQGAAVGARGKTQDQEAGWDYYVGEG
ncbi:unnamed protein product [Tuber aestivum]|uniref:Uncharacterized protein n=1 Tax=Tuber aestivum TaxID=59557 RepID=A0A292PXG4_9PEZI|nr:unnamed protein product [Tuber aestivum]